MRDSFSRMGNNTSTEWFSSNWDKQISEVTTGISKIAELHDKITTKAAASTFFDPQAQYDIGLIENKLGDMQALIQQVKNNPLNVNTEEAARAMTDINAKVEQIYSMSGRLDILINTGNITQANAEFLKMKDIVSNVMDTAKGMLKEPVKWQTPQIIDVFNTSGAERYAQEIADVTAKMTALNAVQNQVEQTAASAKFLPSEAVADIEKYNAKYAVLSQEIEKIAVRPMELMSPEELAKFERLREQLINLTMYSEKFKSALESGDLSKVNQTFADAAGQVANMTQQVRDQFAQPVPIKVEWQSDTSLEVFNTTGIQRYQQEITRANALTSQLAAGHNAFIHQNSAFTNILPPHALTDLARMHDRIGQIQQRLQHWHRQHHQQFF